MAESVGEQLEESSLKESVLRLVAAQDLDLIPPDLGNDARFAICSIRAAALWAADGSLCVFVHSDAPLQEGKPNGFERIAHMQDGQGTIGGRAILTNRDANNGAAKALSGDCVATVMDELEALQLAARATVVWDGSARTATIYPTGTANDLDYVRIFVPADNREVTQDEMCVVLDAVYENNLKNPSGGTAKLWIKGELISSAEDEIERHLKGQIWAYFAGQHRPVLVLRQTPTAAGRTDLIILQEATTGGPQMKGVLELKVLRGPLSDDRGATKEGLSQGYFYRSSIKLSFATLALYDVAEPPSQDPAPLLEGQNADHMAAVRVRRFPIFNSPKEWRDAQAA